MATFPQPTRRPGPLARLSRISAPSKRGSVVHQLGELALLRGRTAQAKTLHLEAHRQYLLAGDLLEGCWTIGNASLALTYSGRTDEARTLADETIVLAQSCGSPSARAFAHFTSGELSAATGADSAIDELQTAIELARSVGNTFLAALAEVTLATVASRCDDRQRALQQFESVVEMWDRTGAWTCQWVTLRNLTHFLTRLAAFDDAALLYGAITSAPTAAPAFGTDETLLRDVHAVLTREMRSDDLSRRIALGQRMAPSLITEAALAAIRRAREHASPDTSP